MKALYDVVIPAYGRPELLAKCLASLTLDAARQEYRTVTVVDDAGPQPQEIRGVCQGAGATYFHNKENLGFPGTVNRGVQKGSAPLVLILNTDVELLPGALDILLAEMNNPDIGIAAPMLLFSEGSQWGPAGKVQHAGMCFDIQGKPFHVHIGWSPDNPRIVREDRLRAVTGACFVTRRVLWNELHGFEEAYTKGTYEDVDYCMKIYHKTAKKIVMNPLAVGYHAVGQSSAVNGGKGFPLQQNFQIFTLRWANKMFWDEYYLW